MIQPARRFALHTALSLIVFAPPLRAQDTAALRAPVRPACVAPTATVRPMESSPTLAGVATELVLVPPHDGWEIGRVSWTASDRNGLIYLLQRGDKAEPVVVVNREGKVVHSWGKGMYTLPHALRIDPQGNVWTTDANTSVVIKFSPEGRELMRIDVGGLPAGCPWVTRGVADVAFAPNGHVYIADGYVNARIIEYTAEGRRVREWGSRGSGPGQFNLPHSIVIDTSGIVYVADRENGRVQRFDLDGRPLGSWSWGGNPYSLELSPDGLWVDMLVMPEPNVRTPTLVRVDRRSGRATGNMIAPGGHGISGLPGVEHLVIPSGSRIFLVSLPR